MILRFTSLRFDRRAVLTFITTKEVPIYRLMIEKLPEAIQYPYENSQAYRERLQWVNRQLLLKEDAGRTSAFARSRLAQPELWLDIWLFPGRRLLFLANNLTLGHVAGTLRF